MAKIKILIFTFISLVISYYTSISLPILLLAISCLLDIITGILKSLYIKNKFTFNKFVWGFIKKLCMLILIFIGISLDVIISYTVENFNITFPTHNLFGGLIGIWLVLDELLSVLRNLVVLEVPMPNFLISVIKKLKNTIDK